MKLEYIKNILVLILAITVIYLIFFRNTVSTTELYRIETECGEKAIVYAEKQTDDVAGWYVLESKYSISDGACIAHFQEIIGTKPSAFYIFDLTHNTQIASRILGENAELSNLYFKTRAKLFNN